MDEDERSSAPRGPSKSIASVFGTPVPPIPDPEPVVVEDLIPATPPGIPAKAEIQEDESVEEELAFEDPAVEESVVGRHSVEEEPTSEHAIPQPEYARVGATTTREVMRAAGAPSEPTAAERMNATLHSVSMQQRTITAAAVAVVSVAAFFGGPTTTFILALVVITLCVVEFFDALRRAGFRPATVLAILATIGVMVGAYTKGGEAMPLVLLLLTLFSFLWFLCGVSKAPATINVAVTVFGFVWVGILGAHAALLLAMPNREGMAFFVGAVLVTIAYDTGAYLGGSTFGRHVMAPAVSPNKTWEGLVVGTLAALVIGGLAVGFIHPWNWKTGLALGLVVAVVAPLGDLAESLVKRDLQIKDMGRILPGHGGVLDRFDALLFVLPATYYLVTLLNVG